MRQHTAIHGAMVIWKTWKVPGLGHTWSRQTWKVPGLGHTTNNLGVHYSLVWFSVNERYLRQLNEDLRKELIASGFRPRRAGEWIVSLTKARRTRMRTL